MSAMCVAFVPMAALGAGYTCPDGYTSDAGAATINQCYKSISAGSYWDGDEVKTCPAGSACDGGKMPYESRGAQWGITNYALGGDNISGCDAYHIYACAAGYADGGPGLSSQNQCAAKCENRAVENGHILPNSATVAYPGKCEYNASNTVCDNGYKLTASNVCAPTCTAGITKLRVGNVSVPLYATRQTTPAIAIRHNNAVCYGNLATGDARSQININYGGKTYHSTE